MIGAKFATGLVRMAMLLSGSPLTRKMSASAPSTIDQPLARAVPGCHAFRASFGTSRMSRCCSYLFGSGRMPRSPAMASALQVTTRFLVCPMSSFSLARRRLNCGKCFHPCHASRNESRSRHISVASYDSRSPISFQNRPSFLSAF
jgi:hypothetical protein